MTAEPFYECDIIRKPTRCDECSRYERSIWTNKCIHLREVTEEELKDRERAAHWAQLIKEQARMAGSQDSCREWCKPVTAILSELPDYFEWKDPEAKTRAIEYSSQILKIIMSNRNHLIPMLGRHRGYFAGAIFYIAVSLSGEIKPQKEFSYVMMTTEVTIAHIYKEIMRNFPEIRNLYNDNTDRRAKYLNNSSEHDA